jgi:sugar lactone lactonase YvrE
VLWHPNERAVYWTDINRFLVHRFNTADQSVRSWLFDEPVTSVLLTTDDHTLAVCLGSRVILWQPSSDSRREHGFHLPNWPAVRLNDAGVDPLGSLWVGSMRNNVNADGSDSEAGGQEGILLRICPDGVTAEAERGIGISNTLVWNREKNRFYFGDSLANVIWKYDFDDRTGVIRNRSTHFSGFERGAPDGSTIDEEGYVWNCRWDGACIVRVSPAGEVDYVLEMPTRNITNCTFGGENLDVLYVTTAAAKSAPGDRLAGSLFSVTTKVRGLPENRFRITG